MTAKSIEFKVDNETLRGTIFVPRGKGLFPGVIFFHGSGSKRERYLPIAKELAENGILTLAFDFRGCGESDGKFEDQTHRNAVEDAEAGLDFLLHQNVDRKRIGVCGASFGGYLAAFILPNYFIKSLILRTPAAFLDSFLKSKIKRNNEFDFFKNRKNWESSSVYKNISNFKEPILIIKAGNDQNVPPEVVDEYYNKAISSDKIKMEIIKNADHRLSGHWINQFYDMTKSWFLKTL